jgi:hypothetical protein
MSGSSRQTNNNDTTETGRYEKFSSSISPQMKSNNTGNDEMDRYANIHSFNGTDLTTSIVVTEKIYYNIMLRPLDGKTEEIVIQCVSREQMEHWIELLKHSVEHHHQVSASKDFQTALFYKHESGDRWFMLDQENATLYWDKKYISLENRRSVKKKIFLKKYEIFSRLHRIDVPEEQTFVPNYTPPSSAADVTAGKEEIQLNGNAHAGMLARGKTLTSSQLLAVGGGDAEQMHHKESKIVHATRLALSPRKSSFNSKRSISVRSLNQSRRLTPVPPPLPPSPQLTSTRITMSSFLSPSLNSFSTISNFRNTDSDGAVENKNSRLFRGQVENGKFNVSSAAKKQAIKIGEPTNVQHRQGADALSLLRHTESSAKPTVVGNTTMEPENTRVPNTEFDTKSPTSTSSSSFSHGEPREEHEKEEDSSSSSQISPRRFHLTTLSLKGIPRHSTIINIAPMLEETEETGKTEKTEKTEEYELKYKEEGEKDNNGNRYSDIEMIVSPQYKSAFISTTTPVAEEMEESEKNNTNNNCSELDQKLARILSGDGDDDDDNNSNGSSNDYSNESEVNCLEPRQKQEENEENSERDEYFIPRDLDKCKSHESASLQPAIKLGGPETFISSSAALSPSQPFHVAPADEELMANKTMTATSVDFSALFRGMQNFDKLPTNQSTTVVIKPTVITSIAPTDAVDTSTIATTAMAIAHNLNPAAPAPTLMGTNMERTSSSLSFLSRSTSFAHKKFEEETKVYDKVPDFSQI